MLTTTTTTVRRSFARGVRETSRACVHAMASSTTRGDDGDGGVVRGRTECGDVVGGVKRMWMTTTTRAMMTMMGREGWMGVRGYATQPSSSSAAATSKPRVNGEIVAKFIRLVRDSDDGESTHEIVSVPKAIAEAKRAGLDLVEVNGKASPPVCRFMDYERVRYDQRKRDKEKKKVQSQMQKRDEVKEIRLTAKIDNHDLNVKINAAARFLDAGYRVTFRIMFKNSDGIAMEKRAARGAEIMHNVMGMLEDYEIVTVPKMIGANHMSASINRSTKKKSQKEVV